jgi:general secretion pathway protein C
MARTRKPKKLPAKIPQEVKKYVVELSLQNPDFGARRLVTLLNQEQISISSSMVYAILKHNSLQNRQKRLAKIKDQVTASKSAARKPAVQITDEVAERIVQIALQNPEYGARRLLPLLEKEEILVSASAVYTILRRNGIQTRDKRFAKIQAQHTVEELAPSEVEISSRRAVERPPQPAADIAPPAEQTVQVPKVIKEKAPPPRILPVSKAPKKIKTWSPWFLKILNILLLLLLVFLGFHTWQNIHTAMLEPEAFATITPQSASTTVEPEVAALPLNDYRMILERNLFNISKEKPQTPKKEIEIEKIALAEKDLGLRLVGTVVAEDSKLSRAFIENRSQRKQQAYREGDKANEVLIKKVLRNKVVITTDKGDKLLTVKIEESTKRSKIPPYARRLPGSSVASSQIPGSTSPRTRHASINLDREEVEASLADTDQLLEEVDIYPYKQGDQPVGFRISRVPPQSVLRKIGLRSRDVIVGVNDQEITSPEQAVEFFQTLAEGGDVTIKIKRWGRSRQIKLSIE